MPDAMAHIGALEPRLLALSLATARNDTSWISDEFAAAVVEWEEGAQLSATSLAALQRLREAAAQQAQSATAKPSLSDKCLQELLAFAVGEQLSDSHVRKLAQDLGLRPAFDEWTADRSNQPSVVIIGGGFSGINMSLRLAKHNIEHVILERNSQLGGVWVDNIYPGCGVDTVSHTYAFTEFLNPYWSRRCAPRAEIVDYLATITRSTGVDDRVQFDTEVTRAEFDPEGSRWHLTAIQSGEETFLSADVVICAVGSLNKPFIPEIPGMKDFAGVVCHTATWPEGTDVTGMRVGLVGNGSSGVQIGRHIAENAKEFVAFQRTAHWILPNDRATEMVPEAEIWGITNLPYFGEWLRFIQFWEFGDKKYDTLVVDPTYPGPGINASNDELRASLVNYIREQVGGREDLAQKLTPTYPPFVKRMVLDNAWYASLARKNARLVTQGIDHITHDGVVTRDGELHRLDMLVLATGFHGTQYMWPMEVRGRSGKTPAEWAGAEDELRAYLGILLPDLPNFYLMVGPNSGVGHGGSSVFLGEMQSHFIAECLRLQLETGATELEVSPQAFTEFNERLDKDLDTMVWTADPTDSRYRTRSGRISTNHPWTMQHYWDLTRTANPAHLVVRHTAGTTRLVPRP